MQYMPNFWHRFSPEGGLIPTKTGLQKEIPTKTKALFGFTQLNFSD
jgi:hypothetical protein